MQAIRRVPDLDLRSSRVLASQPDGLGLVILQPLLSDVVTSEPMVSPRGHKALIMLAAVTCGVTLAACGSSSESTTTTGSSPVAAGIRLANCMRSHGVPNFPDVSSTGGVFGQQIARAGVNAQSPAFQSAMNACGKLGVAAKAATEPGSEARTVELAHLAECMRAHGLRTFPDPTTSAPSTPPSGTGMAFGGPGAYLAVPLSMTQSPAFKHAAAACGVPVPGGPKPARAG